MGYKTVVVFDNDHLDLMKKNPEEFVKSLLQGILHKSMTTDDVKVHSSGTNVATVVWGGHVSRTPVLKFEDFSAEDVSGVVKFIRKT
jgi:hypothetical protein